MPAKDKIRVVTGRGVRAEADFDKQVRARFAKKRTLLEEQMVRIALGKPALGETAERIELHDTNRSIGTLAGRATVSHEAKFGHITDFLSIDYFKLGYLASRAIGRIVLGPTQGTGFLVSPGILLTNEHVIRNRTDARRALVSFETVSNFGQLSMVFNCRLDPDRFLYVSKDLDFTLVALEQTTPVARHLERLGWHPMMASQGKILLGHPITIVQYPEGLDKTVVLHNSHLLDLDASTKQGRDPFFWYRSDTQGGSSGSPVFDREWRVIGVHHAAIYLNEGRIGLSSGDARVDDEEEPAYVANEGVRTSVIVEDIADACVKGRFDKSEMIPIAEDLLKRWVDSLDSNEGLSAASLGDLAETAALELPESQVHVLPHVPGVKPEAGQAMRAGSAFAPGISISITIDGRRL